MILYGGVHGIGYGGIPKKDSTNSLCHKHMDKYIPLQNVH